MLLSSNTNFSRSFYPTYECTLKKKTTEKLILPDHLEADVERGTTERYKAVLKECERRVNLDSTVTDEFVAITTDDLVAALGSANTDDTDRGARQTTVE